MSHTLSRKYATPLRLEFGRSRRLGVYLTLLHVTALVMLPFMQLSAMPALLVMLLLLLSYLRYHRLYLAENPDAIRALVWGPAERVQLTLGSGCQVSAALLPHVFIQPWLVILHLRQNQGRKRHLVVLPDMLDSASFRRLRVRLLLEMKQTTDWRGR